MVAASKTVKSESAMSLRDDAAEVGGAQSIQRALRVLRFVVAQPNGARLREITTDTGLNKATCHRILSALVNENFLRFDRATFRYELGMEAVLIGWAARARQDIQALAQGALERICRSTGDTVFLSIRSGSEAVCIDRHVGDFPIKTLTLEVGSRRPLGVGAGSLALLAFLPPEEIEDVLAANAERLTPYDMLSPDIVRTHARETRIKGFAFNDGYIIPGMSAVGVPVLAADDRPVAALSVAAIASRMGDERRGKIVALLQQEAASLSRTLSGHNEQEQELGQRAGERARSRTMAPSQI